MVATDTWRWLVAARLVLSGRITVAVGSRRMFCGDDDDALTDDDRRRCQEPSLSGGDISRREDR
jgi:hypothetical protein